MKKLLTVICLAATLPLWAQPACNWDEAYQKADQKIKTLTLDEKISCMRGYSTFFFCGVPEKGMPYIYLSDASQGVHMRDNLDPTKVDQLKRSTAMPSPISMAATFNPSLAYEYAHAVGEECRAGGIEVLLGPGANVYRDSQNGRNFEYVGEDPLLAAEIAASYIRGMQSTGTAACMKHFICNDTEFYRRRSNSIIDERTLHEIYLPPFKAGIEAGVGYIMTSYNRVNGEWAGQSKTIITELLRKELGFRGCVMSDWGSVYDTEAVIASGQNVEMPGRSCFFDDVRNLLKEGRINEADIDRMIRPMVATSFAFGFYDRPKYDRSLLVRLPEHNKVVYDVAAQSIVLLKNKGLLPLLLGNRKLLVVGQFIDQIPRGRGSAEVAGYDNVTLRDALKKAYGAQVEFAENPTQQQLAAADVVLVSVGTIDSEAVERSYSLPEEEEQLALEAVKANPNTIVLVNSGAGIRMTDWNDQAAAILYGWYPGQCGFSALADILTGKLNPSGKLPMTLERDFKDSPARNTMPAGAQFYSQCLNERLINLYDVKYDEGVLVGYRWYETKGIKPLYPFGFGLSYTTFTLAKPRTDKVFPNDKPLKVAVKLTNTGKCDGAEVVQLYVTENNPSVVRPKKELKAYRKVELPAGKSTVVELEIERKDLGYWDVATHAWKVNPGQYTLSIGTSSADIASTVPVTVK